MTAPQRRPGDPPVTAGSAGYWKPITPSTSTTFPQPPDAVYVSTACQITGKRAAIGSGDTPTATPTLAADVPHPLRFYSIESVTNGATVHALWYDDPDADEGKAGWGPVASR